jgi:hypothetical protein
MFPKPARGKKQTAEEEPPMKLVACIERTDKHVIMSVPNKSMRFSFDLDDINIKDAIVSGINVFSHDMGTLRITVLNTNDVWEFSSYDVSNIVWIVLLAHLDDTPTSHELAGPL